MISIAFTICSLIFNAILFIIFSLKPKLFSEENKIFFRILTCSLLGVLLEVFCFMLLQVGINETNFSYIIINKLILIYYTWWGLLFAMYIAKISNFQKVNNIYYKIGIVLSIIILFLPVYFNKHDGLVIPSGFSTLLVYLINTIVLIVSVILMLNRIDNQNKSKYIPLWFFIMFELIIIFIQINYPQLLLLSFVDTIIIYLVYFTLENPDLYLIKELTQTKSYLEQSNIDKNNFICEVSTEINNKIDKLENNLNSINKNNMNQKVKECLDILSLSKNELLNVLDISSLDVNKLKLTNTYYDAEKIVKSVYLKYKKYVSKDVDYRLNTDKLPLKVYGDSIKVKQILSSLIDNSIKNTKEGFIELRVNAIIKYDVCKLIFTLEDSGEELDYDYLYYLLNYENLLTNKDLKTKDRAEINLNVIKKMVNLMGGTFNIQSANNDKGSKIIITINQKIAVDKVKNNSKYEKFTKEYKDIKTVCLISKNTELSKTIKTVCKKKKLNYLYYDETKKCLDLLRKKEKYDYIFIDENMDKINAIRFLNKCKEIPNFNGKVYIILNKSNVYYEKKLIEEGFSGFIVSSVKTKEFTNFINSKL